MGPVLLNEEGAGHREQAAGEGGFAATHKLHVSRNKKDTPDGVHVEHTAKAKLTLWICAVRVGMGGMLGSPTSRVLGRNSCPRKDRESCVNCFEKQMPRGKRRTYVGMEGMWSSLTKPPLPWVL